MDFDQKTEMSYAKIMNKIKSLREQLGITQVELAELVGTSQPQIRRLELGMRKLTKEWAEKIAPYLGVTPENLLFGNTSPVDNSLKDSTKVENQYGKVAQNLALSNKVNTLQVVGTINAGSFKDISMLDDSFAFEEIQVPADHRFPVKMQYALKVEGDSMNLKYPDGTYVTVVGLIDSGIDLKAGMTVHVERSIGGGQFVETTLKEIQSINGKTVLIPRSSNPVHKQVILEGGEDTEVQIKGVVTGSFRPEMF